MEFEVINDVLSESLDNYDRGLSGIRQCLPHFERECAKLIAEICTCSSSEEAGPNFDALLDIQKVLSVILFSRKVDIGKKLEDLTIEFDRLDDVFIRDYWFNKFINGSTWPTP